MTTTTAADIPGWAQEAREAHHRAATRGAWLMWRQYLCEEANHGHPWVLTVKEGTARIECEHQCGVFPDFGVDGWMSINARIPVTVDIDAGTGPTDYGTGWEDYMDVYIDPDRSRIWSPGEGDFDEGAERL